MKWFEIKEHAAGHKRLLLSWWTYKHFGKGSLKFIAFWVAFFVFCFSPPVRGYSKKYLKIVGVNAGVLNQFGHILSYAMSLVDRIEVFSDNYDFKKITFENDEEKERLWGHLNNKKGVFFICSHLGNTDIMRSFITSSEDSKNVEVNVFLNETHCRIFKDFIKKISVLNTVKTYPVENLDFETPIELKESLDGGGIAFMAGDRVAQNNDTATFDAKLFDKRVKFPVGTFKFAQLMEVPIYFVVALKTGGDNYILYLKYFQCNGKKRDVLKQMQEEYVAFLEEKTRLAPLQFYHFYDLFGA